eukprot:3309419-Pleurochrysis_carterae.AAC.1
MGGGRHGRGEVVLCGEDVWGENSRGWEARHREDGGCYENARCKGVSYCEDARDCYECESGWEDARGMDDGNRGVDARREDTRRVEPDCWEEECREDMRGREEARREDAGCGEDKRGDIVSRCEDAQSKDVQWREDARENTS